MLSIENIFIRTHYIVNMTKDTETSGLESARSTDHSLQCSTGGLAKYYYY